MSRLRVVHVVPSLDQEMGGSVQAALLMSDALGAMDIESSVVATLGRFDRLGYIGNEFDRIRYQVFKRRLPRHYYRSPSLRRHLHRHACDIDVLHVHGVFNFPAAYALATARRQGVVSVVSPHGQLDPYDLLRHRHAKSFYGAAFLRRALSGVRTAAVMSDREGAALQTFGVPLPTRTVGVPVRALRGGSGPRLRERFDIPRHAVVVLFLGRIDRKKRLDILLKSVARVGSEVAGVHTLIVGDGEQQYLRQLRALSVRLGLERTTTWAGTLRGRDKADALDASNIFVLPSENENYGITVVEALLAGVPALISDKVYLSETLCDEGGVRVCATTVDSCAAGLLTLVRGPIALRSNSQQVRKVAETLFSPERVAERLSETYVSAIDGQS